MTETNEITNREELEKEYERARLNPDLREDFVKRIHFEEFEPFVGRVIYEGELTEPYFTCWPFELKKVSNECGSKTKKFPLEVHQKAFKKLSLDEFLSSIIDHEGRHTKFHSDEINITICPEMILLYDKLSFSYFEAIRKYSPKEEISDWSLYSFTVRYSEVIAYTHQLVQIKNGRRFIGDEFKTLLDDNLQFYYAYAVDDLKKASISSDRRIQLEELLQIEKRKLE